MPPKNTPKKQTFPITEDAICSLGTFGYKLVSDFSIEVK